MGNLKISQLPSFTGDTSGSWLVMDNSGLSATYKVQRESMLTGMATQAGLTSLSSSIATTDLTQNNRLTSIESITGSLATTSSLTALSSSIATTDLNQNNTIAGLATTSSLTALSSSIAATDLSQNNIIAGLATTSSLTALSSSIATTDLNQNNRISTIEGRYATTGSNVFNGNQTITGSLIVSNSLSVNNNGQITNTNPAGYISSANFSGSTFFNNGQIYIGTSLTGSAGLIRIEPGLSDGLLNLNARTTTISGSIIQTGSLQGNIVPLTISSNTASLNLDNGNYYTLQLVSGSATHLNPSNIKPGQTVSVFVNTIGSATMTFPSSIKQISGSSYIPTTGSSVDIITLISKDTSSLYLVNAKNFV